MPSDWGLVLGGQRDGRALQGEGQGPPEGPKLRQRPCSSAWKGGKGRRREGRGSCRCKVQIDLMMMMIFY